MGQHGVDIMEVLVLFIDWLAYQGWLSAHI